LRAHCRRRIGLDTLCVQPGLGRVDLLACQDERQPELEPDEAAPRIALGEDPQPPYRPGGPGSQRS
jgi:hypothetical protein